MGLTLLLLVLIKSSLWRDKQVKLFDFEWYTVYREIGPRDKKIVLRCVKLTLSVEISRLSPFHLSFELTDGYKKHFLVHKHIEAFFR